MPCSARAFMRMECLAGWREVGEIRFAAPENMHDTRQHDVFAGGGNAISHLCLEA
jgi:hypothetical protein